MQVEKSNPALDVRAVLTRFVFQRPKDTDPSARSVLKERRGKIFLSQVRKRKETAIGVLFAFLCLNSSLFSSILRFTVQDLLLSMHLFQ